MLLTYCLIVNYPLGDKLVIKIEATSWSSHYCSCSIVEGWKGRREWAYSKSFLEQSLRWENDFYHTSPSYLSGIPQKKSWSIETYPVEHQSLTALPEYNVKFSWRRFNMQVPRNSRGSSVPDLMFACSSIIKKSGRNPWTYSTYGALFLFALHLT